MITVPIFKTLYPSYKGDVDKFVATLNLEMGKASINTPKRIAAFLSQCAHESAGFTVFSENLNYSVVGLATVFPKYFNNNTAKAYARNPQKIANKVYASRMGNGDEASGDGYRYRGRGILQLTGKANYMAFDPEVAKTPELLASDVSVMVRSACWFWTRNSLNALADKSDIIGLTKRINGGTNGLDDRVNLYNKAIKLL